MGAAAAAVAVAVGEAVDLEVAAAAAMGGGGGRTQEATLPRHTSRTPTPPPPHGTALAQASGRAWRPARPRLQRTTARLAPRLRRRRMRRPGRRSLGVVGGSVAVERPTTTLTSPAPPVARVRMSQAVERCGAPRGSEAHALVDVVTWLGPERSVHAYIECRRTCNNRRIKSSRINCAASALSVCGAQHKPR
jgi:hypothetical protein